MVAVSWLMPALMLVAVVVMGLILRQQGQRRAQQEQLLQRYSAELRGMSTFRVYVSRPQAFKQTLKLMPAEARGWLAVDAEQIRLLAMWPNGSLLDTRLPREDIRLSWIGSPSLAAGNLHWFHVVGPDLYVSADTGMNAVQSRQQTADIYRNIAPGDAAPAPTVDFALERNPATLVTVLLFFALLLYATFDGLGNTDMLVGDSGFIRVLPWLGLACPLLLYPLLTRFKVPARESAVLGILFGVALALAAVPLLKRVDGVLAPQGFVEQVYTLSANGELRATTDGLPPLRFPQMREYWAHFETGSEHRLRLRRGGLGLWQLDQKPLLEQARDWYRANPHKVEH